MYNPHPQYHIFEIIHSNFCYHAISSEIKILAGPLQPYLAPIHQRLNVHDPA